MTRGKQRRILAGGALAGLLLAWFVEPGLHMVGHQDDHTHVGDRTIYFDAAPLAATARATDPGRHTHGAHGAHTHHLPGRELGDHERGPTLAQRSHSHTHAPGTPPHSHAPARPAHAVDGAVHFVLTFTRTQPVLVPPPAQTGEAPRPTLALTSATPAPQRAPAQPRGPPSASSAAT